MYGKPGNSGENSNPVEISRKKVIPFEISSFTKFLSKRPKFSVPFVWITSARLQVTSRESEKFTGICKWYNPFLFSVPPPKNTLYNLTEIFHGNFRTNGKRSWPEFHAIVSSRLLLSEGVITTRSNRMKFRLKRSKSWCTRMRYPSLSICAFPSSLEEARLRWLEKAGLLHSRF